MIPLYGFLEGDTLGILLLAEETETVAELAAKMQQSSRLRVARRARVEVIHRGRRIDAHLTVGQAGFAPLERIDVIAGDPPTDVSP